MHFDSVLGPGEAPTFVYTLLNRSKDQIIDSNPDGNNDQHHSEDLGKIVLLGKQPDLSPPMGEERILPCQAWMTPTAFNMVKARQVPLAKAQGLAALPKEAARGRLTATH
jgi:hypothetical protein